MPRLLTYFRGTVIPALVLMLYPFTGLTQIPEDFENLAEDRALMEESTELPTELLEEQSDQMESPLNLNRAPEELLVASGLFTPYQIHILREYREKYGDLYSIYELALLPGFSGSHLKDIAGLITTGSSRPAANLPDTHFDRNHHWFPSGGNMLLINTSRVFPKPAGYHPEQGTGEDPPYDAPPLKFNFRFRAHLKRNLSFRLAFDKDPGEPCFRDMRPEFVSGCIHYQDAGILRQLILGTYRLNHGMGLVNGSGFLHTPSGFRVNRLSLSELKPYGSLNENRFHRGIAAKMRFGQTGCLVWSSYRKMDLSFFHVPDSVLPVNWFEHERTGGLHRTETEKAGRSLGFHHHSGIQLLQQFRNLTLGAAAGLETSGLTARGKDSLQHFADTNAWHSSLGIHWLWSCPSAETFGELAIRDLEAVAMMAGLRLHFSDFLRGLLLVHHYGKGYTGILPSSYGSGNTINNENGISIHLLAEPGRWLKATFTGSLFSYPAPRSLTRVPSIGFRGKITLENTGYSEILWKFQIDRKIWQRTPCEGTTGPPPLTTFSRNKMSLQMTYHPIPFLEWKCRMIVSLLPEKGHTHTGYLVFQQARLQPSPKFRCSLRFLIFSAADWDNRIYIHEPGLYYSFRFPAFYGKGGKVSTVISLKAGNKVTLGGLFSVISYADREQSGSGKDLIKGNRKWETGIQCRLNF